METFILKPHGYKTNDPVWFASKRYWKDHWSVVIYPDHWEHWHPRGQIAKGTDLTSLAVHLKDYHRNH